MGADALPSLRYRYLPSPRLCIRSLFEKNCLDFETCQLGASHMPHSPARATGPTLRLPIFRYGIALLSFAVAFCIVSILERYQLRNPRVSVYLAAIAISVWYCGTWPGVLVTVLSILALHFILNPQGPWLHVGSHDLPYLCTFLLFGALIHGFSRSRQRAEQEVVETQNKLESQVAERTAELTWLNTEYKTILDACPFGIALFDPGRIVRRCNPAYERMLGYDPGEIIGQAAPIPESEEEIWRLQEEQLRDGRGFVNYEAPRIRKDGSLFPATVSATPLFNQDRTYAGIVGLIIDNTERHAQEAERQMLSALVQHSPRFRWRR